MDVRDFEDWCETITRFAVMAVAVVGCVALCATIIVVTWEALT